MTRFQTHSLALAGVGFVSFVAVESPRISTISFLVGLFVVIGGVLFAMNWWEKRHRDTAEVRTAAQSFVNTKRILMALTALGIVAYVGGMQTMATFSAETTNAQNASSSGTLTLGNTQNGGATVCNSYGTNTGTTSSVDNVFPSCPAILTLTNLAPGVGAGALGYVTVKNTGSVDGRFLYLKAPYVNTTLNTTVTAGATVTNQAVTVTPIQGTIKNGDTVTFSYGTNTQDCTVGGTSPVSAQAATTSLTLASCTGNSGKWNFAYGPGTRITDGTSDDIASGTAHTECYDAAKTTTGVNGSTKGTDLDFLETITAGTASTALPGNLLCSELYLFVQEQSGGNNYCWFGISYSNGMCAAPMSSTLNSTTGGTNMQISSSTTALNITGLTGNVKSGDVLYITYGQNTAQCTAGADAYLNATTISVGSCSATSTNTLATFPTGVSGTTIVSDSTMLNAVNNDTTHSITNFDTSVRGTELYALTGNGTTANVSPLPVQLAAGASRTFYIGAYLLPATAAQQNTVQGITSKFGIAFHLDQ
jgi:hypothetical protein